MYCRDCNYDLRGKDGGECPECGRSYDLDIAGSYRTDRKSKGFNAIVAFVLSIICAGFVLALILEAQYRIIGYWLDVHRSSFFIRPRGRNGTTYLEWEFAGIFGWLFWLVQLSLFLCASWISGKLIWKFLDKRLASGSS